eukprot:TRINITY_DN16091_c0_g1_i1.p1 TRINITY_DN16091_c0_g1~~TRINITY_DN16091_c0_g1_i1.p1  ORF type:complete len:200 (-),score=36.67 TRINITY_DN16091_c0_g1_i1:33-632(-)
MEVIQHKANSIPTPSSSSASTLALNQTMRAHRSYLSLTAQPPSYPPFELFPLTITRVEPIEGPRSVTGFYFEGLEINKPFYVFREGNKHWMKICQRLQRGNVVKLTVLPLPGCVSWPEMDVCLVTRIKLSPLVPAPSDRNRSLSKPDIRKAEMDKYKLKQEMKAMEAEMKRVLEENSRLKARLSSLGIVEDFAPSTLVA